ncbi:hypothetical protein [Flavobacterium sp. NKUCC04_CG]|uniref:hypothetical protein n=1 Tax=Flavobacterium sp. NKUCC04_CG TaxID=2842121 RepID=UPI001C5AEF00|nr:hypothetical protein [Flavobacterium sp. NKUCC04_CG]MBW3519668.1 hypothetical protein [Flavobacterium sp. NKUCC04_CG]
MKLLHLFFLLCSTACLSQENKIFERLTALNNDGTKWYNIDGYTVTSEYFTYPFDEKGLKKVFKKYRIAKSDLKVKDGDIPFNNFCISKKQKVTDKSVQTDNYYFVENLNKTITVIWFIKNGTTDRETELELLNAIIKAEVPEQNFVSMPATTLNFTGREINLDSRCYWTYINTVQCPYLGEMNWSIHRTLADAKESVENQLSLTKTRKNGKVISEELVDIEFEGVPTKAKKVMYDFTGISAAIVGMTGGKNLTIYYVAEVVNSKNISCVLSFWNNAVINPETNLTPLLEQYMVLK